MWFFLSMLLHQLLVAHNLMRVTIDDDASLVYQDDTATYLQD